MEQKQMFMCGAAGMALGIVASQLLAKKTDAGNDGKAIECMPPVPSGKRRYLLFGKNGWIGGMLIDLLTQAGEEFYLADSRTENRESVDTEILRYNPTHVLNAAGVTGVPNVDWCEFNQEKALRSNIIGTMNVSDICALRNIHCTLYATGCIFEYDEAHEIRGVPFTEEDKPNFDGSFYSKTKGFLEEMLKSYKSTLVLRLRMPISDDLAPRNFVTKIVRYEKVINIPNSMTVLYDMLPASLDMARSNLKGIYNFCNPGAISHHEVLDMYKEIIDPNFRYTGFSVSEQDKILAAKRSNNELDATKLKEALSKIKANPVPEVHEAYRNCFERMKKKLVAEYGIDYYDHLPKKISKK